MRTVLLLVIAACATTSTRPPTGGPRGLHADEHLAMAHHHDEMARQAQRPPDRFAAQGPVVVPWVWAWDSPAEHERWATVHRSKAAELQARYDEACGTRPVGEVSISPLVHHGVSAWNTSTGVILYLSPEAGPADRLLADLRCHRAWMMLSPAAGMDHCPLDMSSIHIDARGDRDAITLSIVARDPALVGELQRRAALSARP